LLVDVRNLVSDIVGESAELQVQNGLSGVIEVSELGFENRLQFEIEIELIEISDLRILNESIDSRIFKSLWKVRDFRYLER
jgi:limonene-1,2-epoxide hydrolase